MTKRLTPIERIRAARAKFAQWVAPRGIEILDPETGELRFLARQTDDGQEIPDPNPMEIPAGMKIPETMEERLRRLMRTDPRFVQAIIGRDLTDEDETFEEADDFYIEDDDYDPRSPFEEEFDPSIGRAVTPHEVIQDNQRQQRYKKLFQERVEHAKALKERRRAERAAPPVSPPEPPKTA